MVSLLPIASSPSGLLFSERRVSSLHASTSSSSQSSRFALSRRRHNCTSVSSGGQQQLQQNGHKYSLVQLLQDNENGSNSSLSVDMEEGDTAGMIQVR